MTNRVLVGITGGIAAYKVCEVVSSLAKSGIEVRVILTDSATEFITPLTLATLSRHRAFTDADFWHSSQGRPLHIELGEWADLLAIAPLSAHTLSKLSFGLADNLLTNTVLASQCPILVAPAMNTTMWEQPVVQQNWQRLQSDSRYFAIAPSSGILACDAVGTGRMSEPGEILNYIESLLWTKGRRDLVGKHVLVSAGGTREWLDPVRFIGNPATGKQGIAIAEAAWHRGASVTLVKAGSNETSRNLSGSQAFNPTSQFRDQFRTISVTTALEMQQVMLQEFPQADITIMAAAVGDVRPSKYSDRKIPKAELPEALALEQIPDILAALSQQKRPDTNQLLVGFAAQTGSGDEILSHAQAKLERKGLDAIVANAIDQPETGFAVGTNQATFLHINGKCEVTPLCSKLQLAHRLLDFLLKNSR